MHLEAYPTDAVASALHAHHSGQGEGTGYASGPKETGTLEGEPVHRALFVVAGLGATLLLAGCGNETITASESQSGVSVSIVVTSDNTAISSIEQSLKTQQTGVTVSSGDNHTGSHVCGFNVSKNGHSYQVDVYGNVPASTCNSAAQASFLSDAP
jgi:hypothetical protein